MKLDLISKSSPVVGTHRAKYKFAWFPHIVDDRYLVWLEHVYLLQEYLGSSGWYTWGCVQDTDQVKSWMNRHGI